MTRKKTIQYGRFTLECRVLNGKRHATAFLNGRQILESEAKNTNQALAGAKAALDIRERTWSNERREPHIGTVEDYIDAFSALPLAEHERLMLHAHANSDERGMTAGELAHAAGYKGYQAANSLYGALGKKVAQLAGLPFKKALATDGFVYTFALASGEQGKGEHWRWKMHPEVFEALRSLNMV
ncbi:MAG TPA: hypothetical protein PK694_03300 [Rhodospirillales bacterium]|jgi:hypothetical protein|nr:hypothetical protein [Rhodospirillales bacterium]